MAGTRAHLLRFSLALTLTAASASRVAYAQPRPAETDAKQLAQARILYAEGLKLQDKGTPDGFAEALKRFQAAERLHSALPNQLHIAQCLVMIGRLIEGAEMYRTVAKAKGRKNDELSAADLSAKQQAESQVPQVEARIPTIIVQIKEPPTHAQLKNLQISIGDRPMAIELLGLASPIDPGRFKLSATADGFALKEPLEVLVAEREKNKPITLVMQAGTTLTPIPVPTPSPGPSTTNPTQTIPAPTPGTTVAPAPTPTVIGPAPPPPNPEKSVSLMIGPYLGVNALFGNMITVGGADYTTTDTLPAGYGFGITGGLRFKTVYLGLFVEGNQYGEVTTGVRELGGAKITSNAGTFAGASIAILGSSQKTSIWAEFNLGSRYVSQTLLYSDGEKFDARFKGLEGQLGIGISIPATKWLYFVPKGGLGVGAFSLEQDRRGASRGYFSLPSSGDGKDVEGLHVTFFLNLTAYFSVGLI